MITLFQLIKKDLTLELRQRFVVMGLILYIAATIMVVYFMNGKPEPRVWNGLFWVIQLFVIVNAIAKSFLQEPKGRFYYYYSITTPQKFLIAKLIYNILFQLILSSISIFLVALLLGFPVYDITKFLFVSYLGVICFTSIFTMISAIAFAAQQNASVVTILGFPLVLPLLMMLGTLANAAIMGTVVENWLGLVVVLISLTVLVWVLSWVLFPILWQE